MTVAVSGAQTRASAGGNATGRARPGRRSQAFTAYAMILPAGIFYVAFQLLPIVVAFTLSFFSWDGVNLSQAKFSGLANYRQLLNDPLLWHSAWHNVLVAAAILVVQCGGSFLLAAIIQAGIKGGRFFRLVFFAPMVISAVATGMLAIFIYSPSQGLLNSLLGAVGLHSWEQPWLGSSTWALPTVTGTYIVQSFGLSVLLFISALGQVNNDLLEAAEIDGATQGAILWKVVLPMVRPVASVVFLLGVVQAFRLFDQVYVMTAGGPYHSSDTIVTYLYSVAFSGNEVGYGNAIGVLLFVILLVIALIQLRLTRAGESAG